MPSCCPFSSIVSLPLCEAVSLLYTSWHGGVLVPRETHTRSSMKLNPLERHCTIPHIFLSLRDRDVAGLASRNCLVWILLVRSRWHAAAGLALTAIPAHQGFVFLPTPAWKHMQARRLLYRKFCFCVVKLRLYLFDVHQAT